MSGARGPSRPWTPRTRLYALSLCMLAACTGKGASADDCRFILDRIVDLEIRERGFRDDVLVARKREELATLFAADLRHCQGRNLPKAALECVRAAKNSEEISHRCMR